MRQIKCGKVRPMTAQPAGTTEVGTSERPAREKAEKTQREIFFETLFREEVLAARARRDRSLTFPIDDYFDEALPIAERVVNTQQGTVDFITYCFYGDRVALSRLPQGWITFVLRRK